MIRYPGDSRLLGHPCPLTDKKEVNEMKEGIHPKYEQTTIRCACGNVFTTGSTKKDIRVEICSLSIPASRSWLTPVDVLIASTSGSA